MVAPERRARCGRMMDGKGSKSLVPGDFFGNYHIVRRLGKGGMGEVFLVDAPQPGVQYAVKVLSPDVAGDEPDFVERFKREAEFSMRSRHPNLVKVYDAGLDPDTGLCYLVMEYMRGGSLREAINAHPRGLPVDSVVAVAADVAEALAFVESCGMVHRDVKPDNVLFDACGTAKLADLGISRFARTTDDEARVTSARDVVGTPAYMAPEQMLDSRTVDSRADLFSLGVMVWEMLAGRRPNSGESAMRAFAKAIEGVRFPDVRTVRRDTPDGLAALVAALTMPNPAMRLSSARMAADLLASPERIKRVLPQAMLRGGAQRPASSTPWYMDVSVVAAIVAMALAIFALAAAFVNTTGGK